MRKYFNATALKFVTGFIGMIALGLLGIIIASYYGADSLAESASPDKAQGSAEAR